MVGGHEYQRGTKVSAAFVLMFRECKCAGFVIATTESPCGTSHGFRSLMCCLPPFPFRFNLPLNHLQHSISEEESVTDSEWIDWRRPGVQMKKLKCAAPNPFVW